MKLTEVEERRLRFLKEDEEMFGLIPSEKSELNTLKLKAKIRKLK